MTEENTDWDPRILAAQATLAAREMITLAGKDMDKLHHVIANPDTDPSGEVSRVLFGRIQESLEKVTASNRSIRELLNSNKQS